ncbi:MAG: hypothetical protein HY931_01265 [Candidatus Falkowbacteria bacterium]|nr:MAG: hypothetical protein HY931_01265 [Candidatus Falkowbacteria bacterium]
MNKNYWYFLSVILFLALGLAGFLIYQKSLESLPVDPGIDIKQATPAELQQAQDRLEKDQATFSEAQTSNDLELCKTITNSDLRKNCNVQIQFNNAFASQKINDCEKIDDKMFKTSCVENLATSGTSTGCQILSDDELKDACLSITYYNQAKAENKTEICNQIPELIRRANCLSELQKVDLHSDADEDGFDFLQEIINGTDPNLKDTDNDGYQDGYEFQNGFNPDGRGPLNTQLPINIDYCKSLTDNNLKITCLQEFEGNPLDLFNCEKVKNQSLRSYCLKNMDIK